MSYNKAKTQESHNIEKDKEEEIYSLQKKKLLPLCLDETTPKLIFDYLEENFDTKKANEKLKEILDFANSIGKGAYDYFRAIEDTKAVKELTSNEVLNETLANSIKSMDNFLALDSFFYAIGDTKAVKELTNPDVIKFIKSLGSDNAYDYFRAIKNPKAAKELTSKAVINEDVLKFITLMGGIDTYGYFNAIANTNAAKELTSKEVMNEEVLNFVKSLNNRFTAYEYFRAIGTTGAAKELTSNDVINEKVLNFIKSINNNDTAYEYFRAIGTTGAAKELTNEKVLDFAKLIAGDTNFSYFTYPANEYFHAIATTKAVAELTSNEVIDFAKSISSENAYDYFNAIRTTGAAKELTSKEVMNGRVSDFIKSIGRPATSEYFNAIGTTKAVKELTSKEFIDFASSLKGNLKLSYFNAIADTNAVAELTSKAVINEDVLNFVKFLNNKVSAYEYFRAIGSTKAVKELTSKRIMDFAESLGKNNIYGYFRAIGSTKAVAELISNEVMNEEVLNFVKSIGGPATSEYFNAIGYTKAVAELTRKEFIDFASSLKGDFTVKYFSTIANTKAVNELTEDSFLAWLKDSYTINDFMEILPEIATILSYSNSHKLNKNHTFSEDPIINLIGPETVNKDFNKFKSNISGWSNLIKNIETAEKMGLGDINEGAFERLMKLYSRTGGSAEYASLASEFIKTHEDLETLLSGEKGRIDKMIVNGVNSYFDNFNGLPKSVESWGGIKILKLVWENKAIFTPELLVEVVKRGSTTDKLADNSAFRNINKMLPEFNMPYFKTYDLHPENVEGRQKTEELTKEEIGKIIADSLNIIKGVFPRKGAGEQQALEQIKEELESLRGSVGKNLRGRIDYIVGKSNLEGNPESLNFQNAILFSKELKKIEKDINNIQNENKGDALYSYGKILNAVEGVMASKYYNEKIRTQENALNEADESLNEKAEIQKDKMESYIKLSDEVLSNLYQYMTDQDLFIVNSPGRRMLFDLYKNTISEDSQKLNKSIPTAGILTMRSWKRSLDDIFGGRYSGDCTAPPNESDYSGIHFDANFRWIEDPATLILNFYWKEKLEDAPQPIGRTYCFAAEVDGKPMLFIDSLEFLSSFYPGIEVQKALPEMIKDLAKHFNAPVVINTGRVSNREWVNDVIGNAGFNKKTISIKKLGNDVFAEHIETSLLRKEQYFVAP